MTWAVPGWYALALLALAAWRIFRLLAEDTILDRPRDRLTARLGDKWELFITCPFCAGFWISLAWWLVWEAWPHWTLVAATPFAISAVVGMIASVLDSE
jgi:hypothetical protein